MFMEIQDEKSINYNEKQSFTVDNRPIEIFFHVLRHDNIPSFTTLFLL